MTDFLVRRSALMVALAVVFLCLALMLRPAARDIGIPDEFRYAPSDASFVIMVPNPSQLAGQLHVHLCPFVEDLEAACFYRPVVPPEDGPVAETMSELFQIDDGNSIALFQPIAQLIEFGIDPEKPILFSARGPLTGGDFVLVASLQSGPQACAKLIEALQEDYEFEFGEEEGDQCAQNASSDANAIDADTVDGLTLHLKRLDADRIAVFTNPAVFDAIWKTRAESPQIFSQDQVQTAMKAIWQNGKPSLWGYARHTGIAALSPAAFSISFDDLPDALSLPPEKLSAARAALATSLGRADPEAIETRFMEGGAALRMAVWFAPGKLSSSHLDDLLSEPSKSKVAFTELGYGANVSIRANDLMSHMRYFEYATKGSIPDFLFFDPGAPLQGFGRYGAVLNAAEKLTSIDAIDAQLAGFQDRIPDLVVRIAMTEYEAEQLVRSMQLEEQIARDIAVLAGAYPEAAPEFWVNDCTRQDKSDEIKRVVSALGADGGIQLNETPGGFSHLWCEDVQAAFSGPRYQGCFSGAATCSGRDAYRYLQSPLNDDDFEYRFAGSFARQDVEGDLENARTELIDNNRFRLVGTFDPTGEQLWIASDTSTLQRIASAEGALIPVKDRLNMRILPERIATLLAAQQFEESEEETLYQLGQLFEELSVYGQIDVRMHVPEDREGVEVNVSLSR